jgi:hypothetical protein
MYSYSGRRDKGDKSRRAARQRALILSFLPINLLVNLIAVNQKDPYDSNNSDGGPEFPSQSTIPESPLLTILIIRRINT